MHDLLRHVDLLRLSKGILAPTRAAGLDIEVIRRLRSWFGPDYGFTSMLATDTVGLLAAEGPSRPQDLAGRLPGLLGDRWVTSRGQPLDQARILSDLYDLAAVLVGLDLIQASRGVWAAGPSARWLLPRATARSNDPGERSPDVRRLERDGDLGSDHEPGCGAQRGGDR